MAFRSKYSTEQMEKMFDKVYNMSDNPDVVITVDVDLSMTSENPVQNKAITKEINLIKESVGDNSENIEVAVSKSEEAHDMATEASENVQDLIQQVAELTDKVDKVESGEISWTDVQ